jgi:hypothetical protein
VDQAHKEALRTRADRDSFRPDKTRFWDARGTCFSKCEGKTGYREGDVLGLLLDFYAGTLTAYKNGVMLGEMISVGKGLGAGPFCWVVDLYRRGDAVRLVRRLPPEQRV